VTRYFYTDPLAAAWMAAHHSVSFEGGNRTPLYYDGGVFRRHKDCGIYAGSRYYVASNALRVSVFEPRVHDLITFVTDNGALAVDAVEQVYDSGDESYPYTGNGETVIHLCATYPDWIHASRARIIQRDGKSFMWPECEA